jgi:phage baseplate assembly protein V
MLRDAITIAEIARCLANMIRPGAVAAVDYPNAMVRVKAGDLYTGWLPWLTVRAGKDVTWWPPEVGEQVLILCPDGDPAQAVVLMALYSTAQPSPADRATIHVARYEDGAEISYDREAHILRAVIPGDIVVTADGNVSVTAKGAVTITSQASIRLEAPAITLAGAQTIALQTPALSMARGSGGGKTAGSLNADINLTGDLTQHGSQAVTGAVTVTGNITASGDIMAAGSSDNHHSHP